MNATAQTNHFNLHVSGIGYLNRVRWVETTGSGRKAQPFLSCSISALRGNSDQPDYTYFDLRVSGRDAIEMVDRLKEDIEQRRKVVVSFRVGDIYPHLYERDVKDQDGRKTGRKESAVLIKGRLLLINSITIDGKRVFTREAESDDQAVESHDPQDDGQYQEQVDKQQSVPSDDYSQEQPKGREDRATAPRAYQARTQQPRPTQAPRQQSGSGNTAYRAGHAAGRATRYVADHVAA